MLAPNSVVHEVFNLGFRAWGRLRKAIRGEGSRESPARAGPDPAPEDRVYDMAAFLA